MIPVPQGAVPISEKDAAQGQRVAVQFAKEVLRIGEHHQCRRAEQECLALLRVVVLVLVRPGDEGIPVMWIRLREYILEVRPMVMDGFVQAICEARDEYERKCKIKIPHAHKGAGMRNGGKGRGANDSYAITRLNAGLRVRIS